ncbi:MAG: nucleotidyl transferase AbiEii/AbiGii toxin family protein [Prevotellaceae bacterium]|jgi:hypothetical protein|nr:nucleotidyl transferase AbiEii/AbiGii toxin family protein [Prevotellaceae bacterium]
MNKFTHLQDWLALSDEARLERFRIAGEKSELSVAAVEKDWWVTHTLSIIFSMSCAKALVFKGGTSLSKAWRLIERFSEDIDLALDREFLGFGGELSHTQIRKLRTASYDFLSTKFTDELSNKFTTLGFKDVKVKYREMVNHDQDPLIIEIYYPKLTEKDSYLRPGVLVEVGSRSLKEPFTERSFGSIVSEVFPNLPFADKPATVPSVNPERTFLEKVFLLHEEYQRPAKKIRVARLSRHLYDIERLSRTSYFQKAMSDANLYNTIVAHRNHFSHLAGIDYAKHAPGYIRIVPPDNLLPLWAKDYQELVETMIYGERLPFEELIRRMEEIQITINNIKT